MKTKGNSMKINKILMSIALLSISSLGFASEQRMNPSKVTRHEAQKSISYFMIQGDEAISAYYFVDGPMKGQYEATIEKIDDPDEVSLELLENPKDTYDELEYLYNTQNNNTFVTT